MLLALRRAMLEEISVLEGPFGLSELRLAESQYRPYRLAQSIDLKGLHDFQ